MTDEILEPAVPIDSIESPLRNVRAVMDGTNMFLDLIPSKIIDHPPTLPTAPLKNPDSVVLDELLRNSRPIVEGAHFLRVHFEWIQAVSIQEEFVELFEIFNTDNDKAPTLKGGRGWFPFLEVVNSKWRQKLPDYQGGDDPQLKHYKIVSMETHLDVMGVLESTEWLEQEIPL